MSKDHDEILEQTAEDIAQKAELKTAEKAKKAAKEAAKEAAKKAAKAYKKAQKKLEKKKRKEAASEAESDSSVKKQKAAKVKAQSGVSASMSLGAKLQAVARLARSNLASGLLEHGLYAGQEQVLFLLDEHGPLALTELAEKLDVRAPTITKTVTRMEAQSFLSRAVSRDDARSIIIALTPEGRRVLKIGRQIVKETEAAIFAGFKSADRENLTNCLDIVLLHSRAR